MAKEVSVRLAFMRDAEINNTTTKDENVSFNILQHLNYIFLNSVIIN
jgi:hypothetical protein